ncbi:PAS domain-containing protein [Pelagicoccus enzymogenes]|uniref:PAS domain-containing sensor histidine kinase n=1 Tax=Pelagicoccus enzymogenes TaxID=2773457 RepID=UPI00280FA6F1|nr:PAS domain-containing protein [Pelagicoccus enzymogenes]MDQ8199633.1 PAS domain-containing protein [Pelagicoccus enzymogenes]
MPIPGADRNERILLRSLIDHLPDVVYVKDLQHRFVAANKAAAQLLGEESPENLIGKTDSDYFPKEMAEVYHGDERRLFETGCPLSSKEETGVDSRGEPFTYMVTKTPIYDLSGAIVGLAGIGRDLSEIQQQKRLVELEREQLQTVIDNIPDPIYFKDTNSRYLNGNKAFYRRRNANCIEEVVGKSDFDFYEPDAAQTRFDDEAAMFRDKRSITKEEHDRDFEGNPLVIRSTKTPILDPQTNEPVGMVGISRDITELRKAHDELKRKNERLVRQKRELAEALSLLQQTQTQLVHSEKMASLGVLTAGIAHEINNPINFVYAGVNSMSKDFEDVKAVVAQLQQLSQAKDPAAAIAALQRKREEVCFDEAFEALEETLSHIKLGATRITEIVAGLSKFSRLGKEDWLPTNLHEDIESVLVLLKNKYKTHVTIHRDFTPELPAIVCIPGKLNQAFMNLIANAVDAIEARGDKGTIRIVTRAQQETVSIRIADDGIGMSETISEKVFDPFFTTKGIGKGTGLGLSITYSIVQDHRGSLEVESAPGKGSAFTITLPIEQEQHRPRMGASQTKA